MTDIDVTVEVVDEPTPVNPPVATDTGFLLATMESVGGDTFRKLTRPQDVRDNYPSDDTLAAYADTFFGEGGATLYFSDLGQGFVDALEAFTPELGPGQVIAPEVTATSPSSVGGDLGGLADWAWATNRIPLLNAPSNATDATLIDKGDDVITAIGGRNAGMWADWLTIPGFAGGPARQVPATVAVAGMIARNDRASRNPGLAAAGEQGIPIYAKGIVAERSESARHALNAAQINTFKTVFGLQPRNYGFLTLADLDTLPQWWDLSGSRTIMAIRARERAIAETFMWKTIDGEGVLLDRYEGALRGALKDLWVKGALFGSADRPAYSVNVSAKVNPLEQLAEGEVSAEIRVRTSPPVRNLSINIVRRALTQDV